MATTPQVDDRAALAGLAMRAHTQPLGRKQRLTQADWVRAQAHIARHVSSQQVDDLVGHTVEAVRAAITERGYRPARLAYGWSGGKDSVALGYVVEAAGVTECVMGMTNLEYPQFLQWVTDHMPPGLEVVNTGQDLDWLASHPGMLFPQDATTAAKWFKAVQHTAQARYYRSRKLDAIILGRRSADGNHMGPPGEDHYTDAQGITRWSPLKDWSHEDVLAVCHWKGLALPPIYTWPNGFRVGTGSWPARQYTKSEANAWREVWTIDPSVVRGAALHRHPVTGAPSFPGAVAQVADGRGIYG